MLRKFLVGLVLISIVGAFFALPILAGPLSGKVEVNSWWTAGGEAEGLNALIKLYESEYPDIDLLMLQ